jgi:hypothetical protein
MLLLPMLKTHVHLPSCYTGWCYALLVVVVLL